MHAARRLERGCGLLVDQRDAVPQEARDDKRALADREPRLRPDPDEAGLDLLHPVAVPRRERGHRRPSLAVVADVLALVQADRAALRRGRRRRELRPAGDADVRVHRLGRYEKWITLRMPSCASISSKPRFTSASFRWWETNGSTSMSPASQRSISAGTPSRPLTPPNDEPATRRPVIMANFLRKSYNIIFKEFSENYVPDLVAGDGDVKYHLGYESVRTTESGDEISVRLAANPSHLEIVDPVVEGKARARQRILEDTDKREKVLPLLIHGDAAFAGQGIVAEVLNLSQLPGYETGGTVHVIVNNQIGFTTLPADARSTMYCTDVAKMIEAPIFHVNGDDPIAVEFVSKLALDFRQKFSRDVVLDMYCYRRYGHNETDEPSFTQPKLYKKIHAHPAVTKLFKDRMLAIWGPHHEEAETLEKEFRNHLEAALGEVRTSEVTSKKDFHRGFEESTAIFQPPYSHQEPETRISREMIDLIVDRITRVPDGFMVQPQVRKLFLDRRKNQHQGGGPYDWAFGEALAFGSLLAGGHPGSTCPAKIVGAAPSVSAIACCTIPLAANVIFPWEI